MSDEERNAEQDEGTGHTEAESLLSDSEPQESIAEEAVAEVESEGDAPEGDEPESDAPESDEPEDPWAADAGVATEAAVTADDVEDPSVAEEDDVPQGPDDGALWGDSDRDSAASVSDKDPWVRVLMVTALSLVVVLLVTTVAFYFYTNTLNHAPRTATEHAIAKAEVAAVETPKYVGSWRDLAYAYAGAGRYDEALDAAAQGEKLGGGEVLATVRGNVLRMAGRDEDAIKAYDEAETKVKALLKRVKAERAKVGVGAEIENDMLFSVYYGRAEAKLALGDSAGALKDYELASKEDPYQADVWAALGQLYEKAGKVDKARDAYKMALQFVDDLKPAVDGLKRVGEGE